LLLDAAVLVLEVLPLGAWLLLLAAYNAGSADRAALPLWFLASIFALCALIARALRTRPALAAVSCVAICLLLLPVAARISPSLYGALPGGPLDTSWLEALNGDIASVAPRLTSGLGLVLLLAYLGWRGAVLGGGAPAFASVLRRFQLSTGALV